MGWSARRSSTFHCIWGRLTSPGISRTRRSNSPRPGVDGGSSEPANSNCMPTQMPMNGRPASTASTAASSRPVRPRAVMQGAKAPTPGSTTARASAISPRSAVNRASAPARAKPLRAEARLPIP